MIAITSPRDLAQHALAAVSLGYAKSFLPLVRRHPSSESGAAAYGAVCGYYARPFTNNQGFGRLSSEFVPEELKDLHQQVLRDRNRIFMHTDSDVEIDGVSVNNLEFVSDSKTLVVQNVFVCPGESFLGRVEDLIERVRSALNAAVDKCLNEGPPSQTKFPAGTYSLNLKEQSPWFVRSRDST